MLSLFFLFFEWFESCFINLHRIVFQCRCHWWGWCDGHEHFFNNDDNSQCFFLCRSKKLLSHYTTWGMI